MCGCAPPSATCVPDHLAQFGVLGKIIGLALLHGEQMGQAFRSLNTALQIRMFRFPNTDAEVLAFLDVWLLLIAAHTHASVRTRSGYILDV